MYKEMTDWDLLEHAHCMVAVASLYEKNATPHEWVEMLKRERADARRNLVAYCEDLKLRCEDLETRLRGR